MRNVVIAIVGAFAIVAGMTACGGTQHATRSDEATPLPALTLPLLDGGTWSSESARGTVLVIDVWASWCKPCGKGFPALDALAKEPGVTAIAVSIDEDPAAIRGFLAEFPLSVPVAHDVERVLTGEPLRVANLPAVLIVDAQGIVRHHVEEPHDSDYAEIRRRVDELVQMTQR